MDFKKYLIEEEKKIEKMFVCFVKDSIEEEVYTILSNKTPVSLIIDKNLDRYSFLAGSEALKLVSKGFEPKLFDLSMLKKHIDNETKKQEKEEKE